MYFLEKTLIRFFFYQKYDHKIILEEQQKYSHVLLYIMSLQELYIFKYCFDLHLAKGFIQSSSAPYLSLILFIKKLDKKIQFCVDYQRLNIITKKD